MKKILFITKNFPPQKGWMEQYSYDLYENLKKKADVKLIANTHGKKFLPLFGIIALLKGLLLSPQVDVIYIWDWSISLIGYILWKIYKKEICITIHWLDIAWDNRIYQAVIPKIIAKFSKIVCVSSYTKDLCIQKGIDKSRLFVINNGLDFSTMPNTDNCDKGRLFSKYWIGCSNNKTILLSIGRFVERKWIHTFLEDVFSKLDGEKFEYVIIWWWKWKRKYTEIISNRNLTNVHLVWKIPRQDVAHFCSVSDIFIMPNISVPWDPEGFGIVVIEAGYYGLPVIATKIEWIKDALQEWVSGIFIEDTKDRDVRYIDAIINFDRSAFRKEEIKEAVLHKYSWEIITGEYLRLLR